MAKLGEGDARWIVADRKDGTNLNNWHWAEKDVLPWAKQRLSELLGALSLIDDSNGLSAKTGDKVDVSGEAIINNRKNKLIASYELEICGQWTGRFKEEATSEGSWKVPYLAEENADEEPEIQISTSTESESARKAKAVLHTKGRKVLAERLQQFVSEIQKGGPVPRESSGNSQAQSPAHQNGSAKPQKVTASAVGPEKEKAKQTEKKGTGRIGAKRTFKTKEKFYARSQDIFDCFVNSQKITAYTQSPAKVDAREGGAFSMFGGSAVGKIISLKPPKELVLEWRFQNWKDGDVSKVSIKLEEPSEGTTELTLEQTNIPDEDRFENSDVLETTEAGWRQQIFHKIRVVFGYGLGL